MPPDSGNFLDTSEGEVSLFRSIMRTRPVGIHRHVHVLAIHNSIYRDTGFKVPMKDIWEKLNRMYDLEALELAEFNGEDPNSDSNSPSPEENLQVHPSFKEEFNPLILDESYEAYFAARRVRPASATPTPTPSPSPPPGPSRTGSMPNSSIRGSDAGKKQRHKEKLKLAGLDDSDSSALTQSGDEVEESSPPPQDPPGPGTEVGTEPGEEEDVEMAERSSPEPAPVVKPTKAQKFPKKGASTRTRSSTAAATTRPTKKRKR